MLDIYTYYITDSENLGQCSDKMAQKNMTDHVLGQMLHQKSKTTNIFNEKKKTKNKLMPFTMCIFQQKALMSQVLKLCF